MIVLIGQVATIFTLKKTQFLIDEIIQSKKRAINLLPRSREVRKFQHQLISHYQLKSISVGVEPHRYVRLFPSGAR
jgi:predicted RNA-binding protein Jag